MGHNLFLSLAISPFRKVAARVKTQKFPRTKLLVDLRNNNVDGPKHQKAPNAFRAPEDLSPYKIMTNE